MRALIVDADMLSAWRLSDALSTAGFNVIGPARSSGEALLLVRAEPPDVVLLRADLEARGAGPRLADRIERELKVPTVLSNRRPGSSDCSDLVDAALELRRQRATDTTP